MVTPLLWYPSLVSAFAPLSSEMLPAILAASSTSKTASMRLHLSPWEPVCLVPSQILETPVTYACKPSQWRLALGLHPLLDMIVPVLPSVGMFLKHKI